MSNPYINDHAARAEMAGAIARLLADTYTLALKFQGFHWNVVGPQFYSLHAFSQAQYTELFAAIDELAERMRALGVRAPASFSEFAALRSIDDETSSEGADAMLRQLLADHSIVARTALQVVTMAEAHGDAATADIATQYVTQREKAAWMLDSLLQR
jgi:starvation-inducible DNA-binding protein